MICERCGGHLENDDLFCPKCGKAVFEEYMDEDDVWENYKPLEDGDSEEEVRSEKKEQQEDLDIALPAEMMELVREEVHKKEVSEEKKKPEHIPARAKKSMASSEYTDDRKQKKSRPSKGPLLPVCILILCLCLLCGVIWGVYDMKKNAKEEKEYYETLTKTDKSITDALDNPKEVQGKTEDTAQPNTQTAPKQEFFVMAEESGIDFSKLQKIPVAAAEANSAAASNNYDYGASSAVDGDLATSWQEGQEGLGEGTGVKLTFDGPHKVRYLRLYLGNWRDSEMWSANARPSVLTIQLGDGIQKDVEFSNEMKAFCLSFDEPVEASYVSLYIKSGFEGTKWSDNCISEIEVYE